MLFVRIDKNRKLPVTSFLRALGLSSNEQIREVFGDEEIIEATLAKDTTSNTEEGLLETYRKLRPGEPPTVESANPEDNTGLISLKRVSIPPANKIPPCNIRLRLSMQSSNTGKLQ